MLYPDSTIASDGLEVLVRPSFAVTRRRWLCQWTVESPKRVMNKVHFDGSRGVLRVL